MKRYEFLVVVSGETWVSIDAENLEEAKRLLSAGEGDYAVADVTYEGFAHEDHIIEIYEDGEAIDDDDE